MYTHLPQNESRTDLCVDPDCPNDSLPCPFNVLEHGSSGGGFITCAEDRCELAMFLQRGSCVTLALPGSKVKTPRDLVKAQKIFPQVTVSRGLGQNAVKFIIQAAGALKIPG